MPPAHYDEAADEKLILRLQRGDTSPIVPLIEKHLRHVRMFAALKSPAPEAVDDIARETFVIAFHSIRDFTVGMSFRAWLRSIAWDLVRAEIARRKSVAEGTSRFAQARLAGLDRETAGVYEVDEVEALEEGIDQLPSWLREFLALKYAQHLTNEEICTRARRKIAWVRTVFFRARQQLSNFMAGKSGGPDDAG